MLTDLSHGNKPFAAAIMLGAILACAPEALAQSVDAATSKKSAMDLQHAIASSFDVPPGQARGGRVLITVHLRLDKNGAIVGSPEVTASGGNEAARESLSAAALRAVQRSSPFPMLPKEKYESWNEVVLHFESGDPTP
ncbi:hypothetical protein E0I74_20890 [Rhizobium laguerreae]|uniref:Outer membrane biosynthesis protein TonB n=1 Tax=Rhizobium laguerreae TaxID=1076926 RepID=A0ABR6GEJ9_9HYPH|nr:TonB C-terminal domain-containing protein [Rhizobium laguerreae]MBB3164706.1 outer membrane biosynthesis protein TonB [Rhizobium laguerreae]MBN9984889.1 TonB C-terminal domain-containing protein [Rhizobium laguerreae]MBY3073259.1 TonB C-terminal domain-containing protein [Rhizobium laguerreae]MBY3086103.1 TonB C-terminal domain-containing protein [Rhizobium laguerreae]MBY3094221.1 TonB C-terminal domain-containing protein [Rhizobium laguerreae]